MRPGTLIRQQEISTMRTMVVPVALVLLFASTTRAAGPETSGPAVDEVKKIDALLNDAAAKKDTATLARHTADEFLLTDPNGEVSDKKANMEAFRSGAYAFDSFTDSDVKARVYGDTGVIVGRSDIKGKVQGQDITGPYRFTRLYVRREGRWQMAAEQLTRIGKP
jgi:ketosteroid isomerase-like protein